MSNASCANSWPRPDADVTIKTPQGAQDRIVVFVSKDGLPPILRKILTAASIPIVQATPAQGHAEVAAEAFRLRPAMQRSALGGEIEWVNAAILTNGVCTKNPSCPGAFTRFIDRPGFTIEPGDMGFMDRAIGPPTIFNQKQIAWDRARYGSGRAFDVVVNAAIEGGPSDLSDEDPVDNPGD